MKNLLVSFLSICLLTCQSGQIDKYILGRFANAATKSSVSGTPKQVSQKETVSDKKSPVRNTISEKIEIPAFTQDETVLYRTAYTTCYDKQNKIPKWVAWCLTSNHTTGEQRRLSNFIVDEDVPAPRAELVDYKGSGYDRGHMCPAGDNKWGFQPMRESFYLTNICPQNSNLNCGDWNELEIQCRDWANKYGEIYIACGPILYKGKHETIGPNKVTVPEAFFKVILCMKGKAKAIGFIYKNVRCNNSLSYYVNSIDEVERITGLDFFPSLPDDIENEIEATCNINEW